MSEEENEYLKNAMEFASVASTLNRHYDSIESAWRREKAESEIIDRNAHTITADSTTYD